MLLDKRMAESLGVQLSVLERQAKQDQITHGRYAWNWKTRRGIAPAAPKGLELVIIGVTRQIHVVNGKPHFVDVKIGSYRDKPGRKYPNEVLRALRAERGVGKVRR